MGQQIKPSCIHPSILRRYGKHMSPQFNSRIISISSYLLHSIDIPFSWKWMSRFSTLIPLPSTQDPLYADWFTDILIQQNCFDVHIILLPGGSWHLRRPEASLPLGELLIKLQGIVPIAQSRSLCHLSPITPDVALHNADSENWEATHVKRTSTGAAKGTTVLCNGLDIWPVTFSPLVRHAYCS